jgi:hypothetical protein
VILVDANLLVYAHVAGFPQHETAREWLDGKLNGAAPVGLPWESLLAFLRLVTNPRVFEQPEPTAAAWAQVQGWLGSPNVWIPLPTDGHRTVFADLLSASGVHANLVPDAHLAALAIEHGLVLCSTDGDFARFAGLRWENPLAG